MKRISFAIVLLVAVSFCIASCGSHRKTLGCPGMITKANSTVKAIRS